MCIRDSYNTYGPEEVGAQIKALRDTGNTGGYLTWNGASVSYTHLDVYKRQIPVWGIDGSFPFLLTDVYKRQDLGPYLLRAVGVVGLPDGVVGLHPRAYRRRRRRLQLLSLIHI